MHTYAHVGIKVKQSVVWTAREGGENLRAATVDCAHTCIPMFTASKLTSMVDEKRQADTHVHTCTYMTNSDSAMRYDTTQHHSF